MENKVATIYKNQLQEYTQKVGKRLPIYQSFNEDSENFPKHRAKVLVDGVEYISKMTHSTKKQTEQKVAKITCESIFHEESEVESFPFLYEDPTLRKSILNEFVIKKKMKPTYNMISQEKGQSPIFIFHFAFGGKTYIGEEAGNKKLAEHLAARTAIKLLLETNADTLSPIIMSKVNSDDYFPKCSGNLQGESSSRHKRNANTNNERRNKKRRFGN
uniref:Putative ovule protein n=1 Tax=Solanum chacoense TaxID=4108 RepID=A0A0V0H8U1_SOLCH